MDSSRRWLIIFAIIIGVFVIATVSVVLFTKGNKVTLLSEDTPQGIVQRYLIAIQEKNFQKAFNYLSFSPTEKIITYDNWIMGSYSLNTATWKASLGKTTQDGDIATVEVTLDIFRAGEPLSDTQRSQQITFQLKKIGNSWFITSPTYLYWIY